MMAENISQIRSSYGPAGESIFGLLLGNSSGTGCRCPWTARMMMKKNSLVARHMTAETQKKRERELKSFMNPAMVPEIYAPRPVVADHTPKDKCPPARWG